MESINEPKRSAGHVGFYWQEPSKRHVELYIEGDDVWVAPIDNVIDIRTGNRIGRWEGSLNRLDIIKGYIGRPWGDE